MKSHEERVIEALKDAFPQGLTAKQIMAVIRFSKLVRYRARSNAALNSMVKRVFSWLKASFRVMVLENYKGEKYDALICEIPVTIDGAKQNKPDQAIEEDDKE